MGVLYLARDPLLHRTVAIKILSGYNEELRERFAREARSCAALSHTHIVTIYDVGDDQERPFIAMEFLDGETMAELIRRKAALPLTRKMQLLLELCAGLGYAHRLGIIHRDIKPANLMITSSGVLKILDFGLARLTQEGTGAGLTQVGALLGTPHYMSPEQIEGGIVDQRSDIFSVGLVFYELLCYRKAYPGDAPHAVLHKITHEAPPPLRDSYPDIDPVLETIVNRAIQRDPDARYQSLETMAADCTRFVGTIAAGGARDSTVLVQRPPPARDSPTAPDSHGSGGTPRPTPRVSSLDAIARRRETQIQLHLDEAQRHFAGERYDLAIEQCEIAAMLDPDEPRVVQLLEQLRHAVDDQQVRGWLSEARLRLSRGSLSEAEQLIQQSLQLRPESPDARTLLRSVKDRRRELELAQERARAVRAAVARARASLDSGALEAALRSVSEALAHDPADAEALRLRDEASAALDERERQQEHDRLAVAAEAEANQRAADGDLDGARSLLRAFSPPHELVDRALVEIESAIAAEQTRRREEQAARRRQEEKEEELREQRAQEGRRREEEAARQRREEEAARRRREEEAARRRREEEAARQRREEDAVRQRREEETARQRREEEDARRQRADAEHVADVEPDLDDTEELSTVPVSRANAVAHDVPAYDPAVQPRTAWYRRVVVVGPLALLLIAGGTVAIRQMLANRPAIVEEKRDEGNRKPDYAPTLADAKSKGKTDPLAAIALIHTIPPGASEFAEAQQLLGDIRRDFAQAAAVARQQAEAANAGTQPAFSDGDRQIKEADALPDAEAVPIYMEATRAFGRAATAEFTPEQLFQTARDAFKNRKTDEAIDYALRALQRNPTYQPALDFLNARRSEAARQVLDARTRASAAGASPENSDKFKLGIAREKSASADSALQTREAMAKFREASAAFHDAEVTAAAKASDDRTRFTAEVQSLVSRADELLKARDLTGAQSQIERLRATDPTNRALPPLEQRVSDLRAELTRDKDKETAAAAAKSRAGDLLRQSRGLTDEEAIKSLEEARKLDPSNQDVRTALDARRKALNDRAKPTSPPPASPSEVENLAIIRVLDDFSAAYNQKDLSRVTALFPAGSASFKKTFSDFDTVQWQWGNRKVPSIQLTPGGGVEAVATVECEVSIVRRNSRTGDRPDQASRVVTLQKSSGRWVITSMTVVR